MNNLTNYEKETIICFNEADKTASVATFNKRLINKLDKLCEERPKDIRNTCNILSGGSLMRRYELPKKWVKVSAPRVMSDEQKQAMRERGKENAERLAKYRKLKEEQNS